MNRYRDADDTVKQAEFDRRMIDAISEQKSTIYVYDLYIGTDDLYVYASNFNFMHADYSFCIENYNWQCTEKYASNLKPIYDNHETINERIDYIHRELDRITTEIDKTWTDQEKAEWINQYIYNHIEYDSDNDYRDVYTALHDGKSVCEGIAGLFILLSDRCGLKTIYASSLAMNHVWNLVNIEGDWYHIDTTTNIKYQNPDCIFLASNKKMYKIVRNLSIDPHIINCDNLKYDDVYQ